MNREIKFRGLRTDGKGWVYGDLFNATTGITIVSNGGSDRSDFAFVIPESVGQFTGLKDKHGIYIYEGDLIRNYQTGDHPNEAGEISFNYGYWGYNCFHAIHLPLSHISLKSEIIGNIHETNK